MKTVKIIVSLLILSVMISCQQKPQKSYIKLVNPNSTEKTQHLFNFIQEISGKYTLSGMHNFCGKGSDYTDQLGLAYALGLDSFRIRQTGTHSGSYEFGKSAYS